MLVNKLWKRMEKVESEKRELETRLGTTPPPSPNDRSNPAVLNSRIMELSAEVDRLKRLLATTEQQSKNILIVCVFVGVRRIDALTWQGKFVMNLTLF